MTKLKETRSSINKYRRSTLTNPLLTALSSMPESNNFRLVFPWDDQLKTFTVTDYNSREDVKERVPPSLVKQLRDKLSSSEKSNPYEGLMKIYLVCLLVIFGVCGLIFTIYEFWLPKSNKSNRKTIDILFIVISSAIVGGISILMIRYVVKTKKKRLVVRESEFSSIVAEFNRDSCENLGVEFKIGKYGAYIMLNLNYL